MLAALVGSPPWMKVAICASSLALGGTPAMRSKMRLACSGGPAPAGSAHSADTSVTSVNVPAHLRADRNLWIVLMGRPVSNVRTLCVADYTHAKCLSEMSQEADVASRRHPLCGPYAAMLRAASLLYMQIC